MTRPGTEVGDRIVKLGSAFHNFYLAEEGGKYTVIDAGCSREFPALQQALAARGATVDDVEAILITHAHSDHLGFARTAQEAGVTIRSHEAEAGIATGAERGRSAGLGDLPWWRPAVVRFVFALGRAGFLSSPRLASVQTVVDGETLDLPGRPTVIFTPGHTVGHAAYHMPDRQAVFSGDALVSMSLFGGPAGPQMLQEPFHTDPVLARESLGRFSGLGESLLLPGHGRPWRGDLADAVAAARAS